MEKLLLRLLSANFKHRNITTPQIISYPESINLKPNNKNKNESKRRKKKKGKARVLRKHSIPNTKKIGKWAKGTEPESQNQAEKVIELMVAYKNHYIYRYIQNTYTSCFMDKGLVRVSFRLQHGTLFICIVSLYIGDDLLHKQSKASLFLLRQGH